MRGSTAGLAEGTIAPPENLHSTFLDILDILFSSLIAAPLVICYWQCTVLKLLKMLCDVYRDGEVVGC